MSGTTLGGKKTAATNYVKYGPDFYRNIGRKGGLVKTPTGGFGSNKVGADGLTGRQRAKLAGAIGGLSRGKKGGKNEKKV